MTAVVFLLVLQTADIRNKEQICYSEEFIIVASDASGKNLDGLLKT